MGLWPPKQHEIPRLRILIENNGCASGVSTERSRRDLPFYPARRVSQIAPLPKLTIQSAHTQFPAHLLREKRKPVSRIAPRTTRPRILPASPPPQQMPRLQIAFVLASPP